MVVAALATLVVAIAGGCSDDDAEAVPEGAAVVDVIGLIGGYDPAVLTVEAGTEVAFRNTDEQPHTSSTDSEAWDSNILESGEVFTVVLDEPGTYEYRCILHPSMVGTVVVE